MSKNTSARRELERLFGKICMIEELGIRNIPKEQRRKIKGYTRFDDVITFHHIKKKEKGGKATVENGALLKGYNHRWLHSLPIEKQNIINECLIEFKASVLQATSQGLEADSPISVSYKDFQLSDCLEIKLNDITPEVEEKRRKFNRAKVKRETQKIIDQELYTDDEEERY